VIAPLDDVLGRDVYRTRITAGRAPAEGAADEIAISETLARASGLQVGDELPVGSYTQEQMEQLRAGVGPGEPAGPEVVLRVVGTTRSPDDLNVQSSDGGVVILPAAFEQRYGDDIANFFGENGVLLAARLDGGDAGIADFLAQVSGILDPTTFDVDPVALSRGGVQESIDLLATATLLLGVIVGIAGLIAVALTVSAQVARLATSQAPLRALGLSPRRRAVVVAAPVLLSAGLGAVLAVLTAWGASSLFPLGVGREAEPNPGPAFDAVALLPGAAAIMLIVAGIVAVAAWRAVRTTRTDAAARHRPSGVARGLDALRLGPSSRIGVSMALERGRGPAAAPVRSALAGAALAVAGVMGVVVFGTSLDHLLATPAAQGRSWDAGVADNTAQPLDHEGQPCGAAETQLLERPNIEALAVACSINLTINGRSVGAVSLTPLRGSMQATVLAGRAPTASDEVGLGTQTLDALDLDIGDDATVQLGGTTADYRVVGRVIVPRLVDPQAIADGAVFTGAGLSQLDLSGDSSWQVVVRFADGIEPTGELAQIAELPGVGNLFGEQVFPTEIPIEVERLEQVDQIPTALALLLAVLGALAVGYLLMAAARRRRRDLAVLKTLGFTRRQVMTTVAWQAGTVAVFGIIVGGVFGIAAGSWLWRTTAEDVGVVPDVVVPLGVLAAVALATFAIIAGAAAIPAHRAADLPPATLLHSE
jgi:putative ABC transport system permease protein